jgi:hypothetical protein
VHDKNVTLAHVAKPLKTYMFQLAPPNTEGLLAQFSFNNEVADKKMVSESAWEGPTVCPVNGVAVCKGCNDQASRLPLQEHVFRSA